MDSSQTTTNAAAPVAAPAPASAPRTDADFADRFSSLWDGGAFDGPGEERKPDSAPPAGTRDSAESAGEEPAAAQEAEATEGAAPEAPAEGADPQTPEWEDFDAYLTQAQIDATKAYRTVKVDGQERRVSVDEAFKGFELSQAGHARMAEVAKARETFTAEKQQLIATVQRELQVRQAVAQGMKDAFLGPYLSAVQQAQQSGIPGATADANYAYQQATQWYDAQSQQIAQQLRDQEAQAQQMRMQALPQERERMLAARPEWRESNRMEADHAAMRAHAKVLGFTDAELGGVSDHRQLLVLDGAAKIAAAQQAASKALGRAVSVDDIVTMATEHAKLQASAPEVKQRVAAAPQMSKPGVRTPPKDAKSAARQNAKQVAKKSGYSDDATAAYLEQLFS